jgi:hypothetical protein
MEISVYVYLTDKRARAQVVHVDPENPMRCGIELEKPQNILGKSSNATETSKVEILIYY